MVPVLSALIGAFILGFLVCSIFAAGADGLRHGAPRHASVDGRVHHRLDRDES